MPEGFGELDILGQCAHILGFQADGVPQPADTTAQTTLVSVLWKLRKEALERSLDGSSSSDDSTESSDDVHQTRLEQFFPAGHSKARPSRGVEAHGNFAKPS